MKIENEPMRCAVCGNIIIPGSEIDDDISGLDFCSTLHYHFHREIKITMDHIMETQIACLCKYPDEYDFDIDTDLIYEIDDDMLYYITQYKHVLDCVINVMLAKRNEMETKNGK